MKILRIWSFIFLALLQRFKYTILNNKKGFFALILAAAVLGFLFVRFKSELFRPYISEGMIGTHTEKELPNAVTNLLSQSLVTIDSSGSAKPNLAEKIESNKEVTQYTLKLKDNLYWVDGTKVRAQDIAFNMPEVEIKTPDEKTIEFKISDSFSPFPIFLAKPIFKKNTLIGMGPYKIHAIQKDQIFVKKLVLRSQDNINQPDIIVRFYPNERIAKDALKLGEVQSLFGVTDINDIEQEQILTLYSKTNFQQIVTIFYDTKDKFMSDENLRKGLSLAAPVIEGEQRAKTPLPPNSWAFNNEVREYLNNAELAKPYFKKVNELDKQTITLTTTTSLKNVGEKVAKAWEAAGIKVNLREESGVPQAFQALLIAQNIPADPDQYSLWHSTQQGTNVSKISNPRIDKDLEDGRKTADMEVRKQRYQDFQKVILDHAPATFLYFPKYNVLYMKKVEGTLKKVLDLQLK